MKLCLDELVTFARAGISYGILKMVKKESRINMVKIIHSHKDLRMLVNVCRKINEPIYNKIGDMFESLCKEAGIDC